MPPALDAETQALLRDARALAVARPLWPYAGWRFDAAWENPSCAARRAIWERFREDGEAASIPFSWVEGLELELTLGHDLSRQLYIAGTFEPNALRLVSSLLEPGGVAIDVGANEGLFSLLMARRVGAEGRVIAVEPSRRERQRLERNLARNGLEQVEVRAVALAEASGTGRLSIACSEHSGQNTLGGFVHEGVRELTSVPVPLETLDELCAGLPRVDLIKVDAEGAEARIIAGAGEALRAHRPVIILELLPPALARQGSSAEALADRLRGLGYLLLGFDDEGALAPAEALGEMDLIAWPRERPLPAELAARPAGGLGGALSRRLDELAEIELAELTAALDPSLHAAQAWAIVGAVWDFAPTHILELGRGAGAITAALLAAAARSPERPRVCSLEANDGFRLRGLPMLRERLGDAALANLDLREQRLDEVDLRRLCADAERLFIHWHGGGAAEAEALLGELIPEVLDGRPWRLMVHGLTDASAHGAAAGRGERLWQPHRGGRLRLGGFEVAGLRELWALDFAARNGWSWVSVEAELAAFAAAEPEAMAALEAALGPGFARRAGHAASLQRRGPLRSWPRRGG